MQSGIALWLLLNLGLGIFRRLFGQQPAERIVKAAILRRQFNRAPQVQLGQVKPGYLADLIAVDEDPTKSVSAMRGVSFVMAAGSVIRDDRRGINVAA